MENRKLILIETFCTYHEVEYSFIDSLSERGLIEIVLEETKSYLLEDQLSEIEKMIRLHQDLELNIAGIDTALYLLQQIDDLKGEITTMKNKMNLMNYSIIDELNNEI